MDPKVRRDLAAKGPEARMWVVCPVTEWGEDRARVGPKSPTFKALPNLLFQPFCLFLWAAHSHIPVLEPSPYGFLPTRLFFFLEPSSNSNSLADPSFH